LFALVLDAGRNAIRNRIGVEHDGEPIENHQAKTESGRCRRRQGRKRDRERSPDNEQKSDKLVTFVNVTQAWDHAKEHRHRIARFAFRRFGFRWALPITSIAALRISWQRVATERTRHFFGIAWLCLGWCVSVFQDFPPSVYRPNPAPRRQDSVLAIGKVQRTRLTAFEVKKMICSNDLIAQTVCVSYVTARSH
jgi:hypothetical protein